MMRGGVSVWRGGQGSGVRYQTALTAVLITECVMTVCAPVKTILLVSSASVCVVCFFMSPHLCVCRCGLLHSSVGYTLGICWLNHNW